MFTIPDGYLVDSILNTIYDDQDLFDRLKEFNMTLHVNGVDTDLHSKIGLFIRVNLNDAMRELFDKANSLHEREYAFLIRCLLDELNNSDLIILGKKAIQELPL